MSTEKQNVIQGTSFLILKYNKKRSAVLPLVASRNFNNFQNNNASKQNQPQQSINWGQLANQLMSYGPLNELKFLIGPIYPIQRNQKLRLFITIQGCTQKFVMSANCEESIKIKDEYLEGKQMPLRVCRIKINGRRILPWQLVEKVACNNSHLYVQFKTIKKGKSTDLDAQILEKLKELKIFHSSREIQNIKEKYEMDIEDESFVSNENSDSQEQLLQNRMKFKEKEVIIPCKVLLMSDGVNVDVYKKDGSVITIELSTDQTYDDLKWMIENYFYFGSNFRLTLSVYVQSDVIQYEDIDISYQLFNPCEVPLEFYNRLRGG